MVAAVRKGASQRSVARQFNVSLSVVQRWVRQAAGKRLDRVDFSDTSHRAHRIANKTAEDLRLRILTLRRELADSILGEIGADAIATQLQAEGITEIPSTRTINRILKSAGAFDARRRIRRQAPKPGWYLPSVCSGTHELDEIDIVEGLILKDSHEVQVLNLMSVHGGRPGSFIAESFSARSIVAHLLAHWKAVGRPDYAQFDNDTRFHGPHQFPDVIGRISRLCMALEIVPVFAPPREHGPQNAIESYNGLWQARVWGREIYSGIEQLTAASDRYVLARSQKNARRIESAPQRRALSEDWQFDHRVLPSGRIVYLRRTNDKGVIVVLGQSLLVDPQWIHRLVRCELDLQQKTLHIYGLRRAAPETQPLLLQKAHPIRIKALKD